jgi:hypothetical protein
MLEAAEGADLRDGDHGGDELESFEGHKRFHEGAFVATARVVVTFPPPASRPACDGSRWW